MDLNNLSYTKGPFNYGFFLFISIKVELGPITTPKLNFASLNLQIPTQMLTLEACTETDTHFLMSKSLALFIKYTLIAHLLHKMFRNSHLHCSKVPDITVEIFITVQKAWHRQVVFRDK